MAIDDMAIDDMADHDKTKCVTYILTTRGNSHGLEVIADDSRSIGTGFDSPRGIYFRHYHMLEICRITS